MIRMRESLSEGVTFAKRPEQSEEARQEIQKGKTGRQALKQHAWSVQENSGRPCNGRARTGRQAACEI